METLGAAYGSSYGTINQGRPWFLLGAVDVSVTGQSGSRDSPIQMDPQATTAAIAPEMNLYVRIQPSLDRQASSLKYSVGDMLYSSG